MSPKVVGSAWMPWLRPMVGVSLCSNARRFSTASSASMSRDQQVRRLLQLHRQRGVEHVGAGHALVQPAPLGPELLAGPGQEGDHVMLGDRLDRVDRVDVDLAERVARRRPRGSSPRPRPGSSRSCPSPRPRTPRSATRCGSGFRPTRWPSFRGGNSGEPWPRRLAEDARAASNRSIRCDFIERKVEPRRTCAWSLDHLDTARSSVRSRASGSCAHLSDAGLTKLSSHIRRACRWQ